MSGCTEDGGLSESDQNAAATAAAKELNNVAFKELCSNNAEFFAGDLTENGQRLYLSFMAMKEEIDNIWPVFLNIESEAPSYDFDENTPGNGYRSFLKIVESALSHGIHINKKVCLKRDSVLFRKSSITKEVEACAQLFASLLSCLKHLQTIMAWSPKHELFATQHEQPHELIAQMDDINQYCFYGRPLGFQFTESIRGPLRFISLSMAIFSEAYYSDGSIFSKATNSVLTTTKYVSDPEQRAKRVVNICKNADVSFCKAFWFLSESELMQYLPSVVAPHVAISKLINIPTEPISIEHIDIPIPLSHIGRKAVQVRLISCEAREGMIGEGGGKKLAEASRGLVIHCHGGGFVAQSSKSHEVYLRQWAKELHVPILSIDYSLAPAAPYPRALEEIMYAYAWALNNCRLLGSTGERVVAAGDSAGANLLIAMTLKCVQMGVPPPHGLFLAYVPTFVNFIPSPSRLLSKLDPLLPFGFLSRCLRAYISADNMVALNGASAVLSPDTESFEEISESDLLELQAHKSPTSEMSDTLTYGSLTSQNDDLRAAAPANNLGDEEEEDGTIRDDLTSDTADTTSQRFDLLDKFVLDSDTDTDGTKIAIITQETPTHTQHKQQKSTLADDDAGAAAAFENTLHGKVSNFMTRLRGRVSGMVRGGSGNSAHSLKAQSAASAYLDSDHRQRNLDELKLVAPTDPLISPYCAPDHLLRGMPPTQIMTVHLDPCLDDCVAFAKRLKKLGNPITLHILDGLPHGFLNFSLVCKEAYEASKLCAIKINELLALDQLPTATTTTN